MLAKAAALRLPPNPLDDLIYKLESRCATKVAELTGRKRGFKMIDGDGVRVGICLMRLRLFVDGLLQERMESPANTL